VLGETTGNRGSTWGWSSSALGGALGTSLGDALSTSGRVTGSFTGRHAGYTSLGDALRTPLGLAGPVGKTGSTTRRQLGTAGRAQAAAQGSARDCTLGHSTEELSCTGTSTRGCTHTGRWAGSHWAPTRPPPFDRLGEAGRLREAAGRRRRLPLETLSVSSWAPHWSSGWATLGSPREPTGPTQGRPGNGIAMNRPELGEA
jgi:hypothetical protein